MVRVKGLVVLCIKTSVRSDYATTSVWQMEREKLRRGREDTAKACSVPNKSQSEGDHN